ncbi:hypothetical protein WDW89_13815 [Deltaproteobacteria bacterium TL4]
MMRKLLLYLVVLVLCFYSTSAFSEEKTQEPVENKMSQPLKHTRKVYVSPNQLVFWPMSKPFWIRLASSPKDDAPSFLLEQLHEESSLKNVVSPQNGIQLEIPGRQFVRWVNFVSKDEVLYKFIADGAAPASEVTLFDAPKYISEDKTTFYGVGLKGTIKSIDDLSGVETTYYSVDGKPFVPYEKTLLFDQEKEYHIRYYAVDKVGYASNPEFLQYIVDLATPNTSHKATTNLIGDTLSLQSRIWLKSGDNLAGVQKILYKFDDEKEFKIYNTSLGIKVDALSDGAHVLTYLAIDNVENREVDRTYTFYLDRNPPKVSYEYLGDRYTNKDITYVSPRTRFNYSAVDNKVDIQKIEYKINEEPFNKYVNPFAPPFKSGDFVIFYQAYDALSNLSSVEKLPLVMDLIPPKSKHTIKGSHHAQGEGVLWITDKTTIELSSADDLSGVQKVVYQIAKNPVQEYTTPISVAEKGQYLFRYWAADNVNNQEMFTPTLLIVDTEPPNIIEVFSIEPTQTLKDKDGNSINVYPVYTTLFVTAIDDSAGVSSVKYSLNNTPVPPEQQTAFFAKAGDFELKIQAIDKVDNVADKIVKFKISDRK